MEQINLSRNLVYIETVDLEKKKLLMPLRIHIMETIFGLCEITLFFYLHA